MLSRRDFPGERVQYNKTYSYGTARNGWTGTVVSVDNAGFVVDWDQGDATTYTWRAVADKTLNPKMNQSDAYIYLMEEPPANLGNTWWVISESGRVVGSAENRTLAETAAEKCARHSETQEAFYISEIVSKMQAQPIVQVKRTVY